MNAGGPTDFSVPRWMDLLEERLTKGLFTKLVAFPWSVFLAAGGAGLFAIPDPQVAATVFTVLGVIITLWFVLLVVLIEVTRRKSRKAFTQKEAALQAELTQVAARADLYAKSLVEAQRRDPDRFSIEFWKDSMTVKPSGETVVVRDMVLLAGDRPLDLVSSILSCNKPTDPETVNFAAFWLEEAGQESVPIHSTCSWSEDQTTMTVFLHYIDSIPPRSELRFRLHWTWPSYCQMMLDGTNETMRYTFNRPCKRLEYELVLEPGCAINDSLRLRPFDNTLQIQVVERSDRAKVVSFAVSDLVPGTVAGFEAGSRHIGASASA